MPVSAFGCGGNTEESVLKDGSDGDDDDERMMVNAQFPPQRTLSRRVKGFVACPQGSIFFKMLDPEKLSLRSRISAMNLRLRFQPLP